MWFNPGPQTVSLDKFGPHSLISGLGLLRGKDIQAFNLRPPGRKLAPGWLSPAKPACFTQSDWVALTTVSGRRCSDWPALSHMVPSGAGIPVEKGWGKQLLGTAGIGGGAKGGAGKREKKVAKVPPSPAPTPGHSRTSRAGHSPYSPQANTDVRFLLGRSRCPKHSSEEDTPREATLDAPWPADSPPPEAEKRDPQTEPSGAAPGSCALVSALEEVTPLSMTVSYWADSQHALWRALQSSGTKPRENHRYNPSTLGG